MTEGKTKKKQGIIVGVEEHTNTPKQSEVVDIADDAGDKVGKVGSFEPCTAPDTDNVLSVLIPAWKTQDYIEECLDGVYASRFILEGNPVNVIVGVDGCPDTLVKLEELAAGKYKDKEGFTILYSEKNNGAYITRNGLINYAPEGWILLFDSDDVIDPATIGLCMLYKNMGNVSKAHGTVFFTKKWFMDYMGGYYPWRCAADAELIQRARALGFPFKSGVDTPFFYRRHPMQTTLHESTKSNGAVRCIYHIYINKGITDKVIPELPEFIKVYPK